MNKKFIRQILCSIPFLLIALVGITPTSAAAPQVRVTLRLADAPLERVMNDIERQTKFLFIVGKGVRTDRPFTLEVRNMPLSDALSELFAGTDIDYKITAKNILLSARGASVEAPAHITGSVRDAAGRVIVGATVLIAGTTSGTSTDAKGRFLLTVPAPSTARLEVDFLGYEPQVIPVGKRTRFDVILTESVAQIESVVVTGLGIKRSKKALA